MKRVLNDLQLNEKVSFKDASYGAGYVMGYNKEIGKHLIGYNAQCKRHSQSFPNSTGQFVQNKDNKYVYSDRVRDYTHFFFADSVLELLNTEVSADGNYRLGDVIEVRFNANGQAVMQGQYWDNSTTRKGTVVGMDDYGVPLLYMDPPKAGQAEFGQAYGPEIHRWIDRRYDGQLNTARYAFVRGNVTMSKSSSKEQPRNTETVKEYIMDNKHEVSQKSFMEIMKGDAKVAGVRIAAEQMSSGLKKALITLMEKKGQSSDRINALKEMLDTTFGKALISYLAGTALTYAPVISEDPRAKMLAAEFRVSGISTAGNELIDVAMEHFLPVLQTALTSLPTENEVKARVGTSITAPSPSVEELEQAEKKTEKTLTVSV